MKIQFDSYNPLWSENFLIIKKELLNLLKSLNPKVEHVGDTAVKNLSSPPLIKILVGIYDADGLERATSILKKNSFEQQKNNNSLSSYTNVLVKNEFGDLGDEGLGNTKSKIIVQIMKYNSFQWTCQISIRDYLNSNEKAKNDYENMRLKLSKKEWKNLEEFDDSVNELISKIELQALEWINKNQLSVV